MKKAVLALLFSLLLLVAPTAGMGQGASEALASRLSKEWSGNRSVIASKAQSAKKVGNYKERAATESNGWVDRAMKRIGDLFDPGKRKFEPPKIDTPNVPSAGLGFLQFLLWFILIALAALGLYFALRNVGPLRKGSKKAKKGALIEEKEPLRTADEWLEQADALERAGQFREAVRALYLATLVRLDENKILRFRRWETNWEHLTRYRELVKTPAIDLGPITQEFDLIWYGFAPCSSPEVSQFRDLYRSMLDAIARMPK
ncbi:MAG: DUF4129 domain-containing protein [Armatimonadetes bacterium]|nr:DUF4129 domain-containing protein [Armatimonadota bacterium]